MIHMDIHPYPYHMVRIQPYTWRGSHAHARAQAVGWGGRESAGKSGKEWEGGLPSAPFGGEGISGKASGGWERGVWTDRRTVPSLSLVPYSFPISPFSPPHRIFCPLSVPYSQLSVPYLFSICSLFSPRHFHIFPLMPASVPIFPCFHTHFPTWVYLSVCTFPPGCTDVPPHLCPYAH